MSRRVLSLLGLALRGGRLAAGEEPVALAAKAGQARLILLAADAAGNTLHRAEYLAGEGHCLFLSLPCTKAELGAALGRGSTAVAALTDTGLAAAVTQRLAELDPERYAEAAARMDLKRRRAKERQSAPRRDPPKKAPPRKDPPPGRGGRRPPSARGDNRRPSPPRGEGQRPPSAHREDRRFPDSRRKGGTEGRDKGRHPSPGRFNKPRPQGRGQGNKGRPGPGRRSGGR